MERDKILQEILSDPEIMEKYNIKKSELKTLKSGPPYYNKIVEVLSVIINDNDNHMNSSQIYKKIKNVHNIS